MNTVHNDAVPFDRTPRVAKAIGAAMAGLTLGYLAGSLTAPASGEDTRRRMRERVEEEKQALAETAKGVKRKAQEKVNSARSRVINAKDRLAERVHS